MFAKQIIIEPVRSGTTGSFNGPFITPCGDDNVHDNYLISGQAGVINRINSGTRSYRIYPFISFFGFEIRVKVPYAI